MSKVNYHFKNNRLALNLGSVDWLKELRNASNESEIAISELKQRGDILSQGAIIGELSADYNIYFLTSRRRIRIPISLAPGFTDVKINKSGGIEKLIFPIEAELSYREQFEVPPSPTVNIKLTITKELKCILNEFVKNHSGAPLRNIEVINVHIAGDFTNALQFTLSNGMTYSLNLVPDLMRFLSFQNKEDYEKFKPYLDFEIHYIGQASTIEKRLHTHEKIREMASLLLTRKFNHEPVIFGCSFDSDIKLDSKFSRDLFEAVLISHFKPALNVEMLNFPDGRGAKEIGLKNILSKTDLSCIFISPLLHLDDSFLFNKIPLTLSGGYGYTCINGNFINTSTAINKKI